MKSNIWKYYAFSFLTFFVVFLPYIVYYFQELGFSLTKIMIITAIMNVIIISFEVPSGYFADKFGRKKSLLFGAVFLIVSATLLYTQTSYYLFIFAYMFSGLGIAFISGADSALIYDTLLDLNKEKEFKKISGRAGFFKNLALMSSALLASYLVQFGIKYTILATLIIDVASLVLILTLKEPKRQDVPPGEDGSIKGILSASFKNKDLKGLFIYAFIVLGIQEAIFRFYQPYFRSTGLPLIYFGVAFAFFSLVAAVSAWYSHKIEEKLGVYRTLIFMPLLMLISSFFSATIFVWYGFMFFFFREFVRGMIYPVLRDYVNKLVSSHKRATVLSMQNFFASIGGIIITLASALISDNFSVRHTYFFLSGALVVALIIIIKHLKMRK